MTAPPSRLAKARQRVRVARYSVAAIALVGFGAGIAAARVSHPGTRTGSSTQAVQSQASSNLGFGSGSYIAPAASAPVIQSSGS